MKQAYKNVDTTLQNAVRSANKKNGTCSISAVSQHFSKLPANAGTPLCQGQKCACSAGVSEFVRILFLLGCFGFFSTHISPFSKSVPGLSKVRQGNSDA